MKNIKLAAPGSCFDGSNEMAIYGTPAAFVAIKVGIEPPLFFCSSCSQHQDHLGQVQVGLCQQVGVMFGHQANNIIKHSVLLVHGYGEVRLLHRGKEPKHTHKEIQATISD